MLVGAGCVRVAATSRHHYGRNMDKRRLTRYCMNQPWLTTKDWPVSALVGKEANINAT